MALRGYDFFLIFRAKSYAGSTIKKVSSDLTGMGHAAQAANAMMVGDTRAMAQMAQLTHARNQLTRTGLVADRRRGEILLQQHNIDRQRMVLQEKFNLLKGTQGRWAVKTRAVEMQLLGLLHQEDLLRKRTVITAHDQMAAEQRINAQLKIRQTQMRMLQAQQMALMREQQLAPSRAMMGRGAALTHTGALAGFTGLAGTFVLGGAAAQAAEFDKLATQAATQIGSVRNNITDIEGFSARLQDEILRLGQTFPDTAEEMSNAAYDIFSSMDVNFGQGIDLLELFAQTAVAGMTDIETATDGAITVLNNFDPALKNPRKTINDMFSIIRFGRIDLETFNTMMNQIAPAAKAADQELIEVGGAIAVLTRRLGPGIASAGLARLFEVLSRRDFQEGMRKSGLAITDISGKLLPLPEIIGKIHALGPKAGVEVQNLIQTITAFGKGRGEGVQSTVQARRALVTLLANYDDLAGPQGVQERMIANQEQFNKQLAAMQRSIGVRWDVFVNQLRTIARSIGQDVIPAFEELGDKIMPFIDAWRDLSPETRKNIVAFAAFASFAALIGGVLTALTGGIVGLIGALRFLWVLLMRRIPVAAATSAASMKMLGDPAVTGKVAAMSGMLKGMAGIGAIAIGLTLALEGSGWQSRIGQLLAATAIGAMQGGVVGAIVIPAVIVASWGMTSPSIEDKAKEIRAKLADEMKRGIITRAEANEMMAPLIRGGFVGAFKVPKKQLGDFVKTASEMGDAAHRVYTEDGKKIVKTTKKTILDQIKAAKSLDEINRIIRGYTKDELTELEKWRKDRKDIINRAVDDAQQTLDQAADNLVSKFVELREANKQAFGTLFEGPWMTGEEMDFAKQWGYIPNTQDLITDLKMQITAFKNWKGSLAAVAKRGAPAGLVKELTALGPEAADKLAMLAKASPAQFNEFVSLWKTAQAEIDKATEADFQKQLEDWYKHGQNIAFKIIAGLETEEQMLKNRFRSLISQSFSAQFIAEQVAKAVAEFTAGQPKPADETTGGGRTGGGGGGTTTKPKPKPKPKPQTTPGAAAASERESGRSTQSVHYHLERRPGESVEDYLHRVKYHFRTV